MAKRERMVPARLALALVLAGAIAGTARADRLQRGQMVFDALCTNCHGVGWKTANNEKGRVDLTRTVDHLNDAELRKFLTSPHRAREASECVHQALEAQQVEDLVSFLHARASAPPITPRTPRRSNNPSTVVAPRPRVDTRLDRGGAK